MQTVFMLNLHVITHQRGCLQLKSSLLLHMDGTSPIAEDIGRQVCFLVALSYEACM